MENLFPIPSLSAAHSLLWSDVNRLEGWGGGSPLMLAGRKIKAAYETKRAYKWRQPSKNRGPCGLPQRTQNFLDALFLKVISFVFIL